MTLVLDRPIAEPRPETEQVPPPRSRRAPRWRLWRPPVDVLWLAPVLLISTIVSAVGLFAAPQRVDDEGTYMAQAYAVEKFGELAHYTYWYDHPPLGWLQLAAITTLTRAFDWPVSAVDAGRIIMLGFNVVSAVLLWTLARRLELTRPAAAGAVALFTLSPLAVYFHRMVFLDNISVLWTIAAFALAASRRHQLASFCGSAASFAVAVLTKETFVLLLPALVWLMLQHAVPATRRYTLAMASALFVLLCSGYLVFSLLKNELVPGPQRVSLFQGVMYQLFERPGSGPVWRDNTAASQTFHIWLGLDAVLLAAGALCALTLFAVRRMRPIAFALTILAAMLLRTGYLPIPFVIALIPFAALLIAAAADLGFRRRLLRPAAVIGTAVALVVGAPAWATDLHSLTHDNVDHPLGSAEQWIARNVDRDQRVLVDDAVWVDLIRAGFPRDHDVWFFKADTDPAVIRKAPNGWRDYDYLMVTSSVRATLDIANQDGGATPYPRVTAAYRHSKAIKTFGSGHEAVQIRRIVHGNRAAASTQSSERSHPAEASPRALTPAAPQATWSAARPTPPQAPSNEPEADRADTSGHDSGDDSSDSSDASVDTPSRPAATKPEPKATPEHTPKPRPTARKTPLLDLRIGPEKDK